VVWFIDGLRRADAAFPGSADPTSAAAWNSCHMMHRDRRMMLLFAPMTTILDAPRIRRQTVVTVPLTVGIRSIRDVVAGSADSGHLTEMGDELLPEESLDGFQVPFPPP